MSEIVWIKRSIVELIHRRQVNEYGGPVEIRDSDLLESALARPRNLFVYATPRPDISMLAAAYAFGLAQNHPFVDGNKRTALVVCRTFLLLNKYDIDASKEERYRMFMELAAGTLSEESLTDWIRLHLVDC